MSVQDIGTLRASVELDDQKFESKYRGVDRMLDDLEARKDPEVKIDADPSGAQRAIKVVEDAGEELVKRDFDPKIDADISKAEQKITDTSRELDVLRRMEVTPTVSANISRAEKRMSAAESRLKALNGLKSEMVVQADTSGAESALADIEQEATGAGERAGEGAGSNMAGGIIAALATIPVAGAVILIGKSIGDALLEGLQNEVREDLFSARTGLDATTAARFGRAAGESYANNWGESIAGNLDTARRAVEAGLLDPDATARDAQAIISQITGVADLLEEDIPRVARSAAQAIKTGIAGDAVQAFDLLVKGQEEGLNVSEDLLDTIDEYGTQFRAIGLKGPQAFGLLSQAVQGGARDTDTAADALKEFAIRAQDGSELSAESFEAIGLNAEEMSQKVAEGGPAAAEALDSVLDRLRDMEPGAERTAAAVGLFGTKAEDLGEALYSMDLSTAVEELGRVEGAAKSALDTMTDNAAGDVATAQRNIEVATDGIKGALAAAFNPEIEEFSTWVSSNREQVMDFLLGLANGALDFGRSFVEGMAVATEGIGDFVSTTMPPLLDVIAGAIQGIDQITPGNQGAREFREWADGAISSLEDFDDSTERTADAMRENLIENGIDPAQERLDEFALPLVAQAALHDASMAIAEDLDNVGFVAKGSTEKIQGFDLANLGASESGRILDEQLAAVAEGLDAQTLAGIAAGETQEDLSARYEEGRGALIRQLEQMGLTTAQAEALAEKYGTIPGRVETIIAARDKATSQIEALRQRYDGMTIGEVYIEIKQRNNFSAAQAASAARYTGMALAGQGPGYAEGGFTGYGPRDQVAGPVHREEFVFDAETTARNRPLFEAIHAGATLGAGAGSRTPAPASLKGLFIEGTLDTPFGPAQVRGVVREEIGADNRAAAGARQTRGVFT